MSHRYQISITAIVTADRRPDPEDFRFRLHETADDINVEITREGYEVEITEEDPVHFGVPYGRAGVDGGGYYVICPECAERFHEGPAPENRIGKSAGALYDTHYIETHEENRA